MGKNWNQWLSEKQSKNWPMIWIMFQQKLSLNVYAKGSCWAMKKVVQILKKRICSGLIWWREDSPPPLLPTTTFSPLQGPKATAVSRRAGQTPLALQVTPPQLLASLLCLLHPKTPFAVTFVLIRMSRASAGRPPADLRLSLITIPLLTMMVMGTEVAATAGCRLTPAELIIHKVLLA